MNILPTLEGVIKEIVIHCGYGPETEIQGYMSVTSPSYEFGLYRKITLPANITIDHRSTVTELFKQIEEPIKNSQLVAKLTEDLTKQVNELSEKVKVQETTIKELEVFKHHYDLEFKLKQGKPNETK